MSGPDSGSDGAKPYNSRMSSQRTNTQPARQRTVSDEAVWNRPLVIVAFTLLGVWAACEVIFDHHPSVPMMIAVSAAVAARLAHIIWWLSYRHRHPVH